MSREGRCQGNHKAQSAGREAVALCGTELPVLGAWGSRSVLGSETPEARDP